MTYQIAEKFKSIQGEGQFAGTPMAFIRFVGCSVGKKICHHCDTDFDNTMPWRGGGSFTESELLEWAEPYDHVCLTGGEPLDQNLLPLISYPRAGRVFHLETSGTKPIMPLRGALPSDPALFGDDPGYQPLWVCVSPKPGFLESAVMMADEVKVIVPGLGEVTDKMINERLVHRIQTVGIRPGDASVDRWSAEERARFYWPNLEDAVRWADAGLLVYLQPRNGKYTVDTFNQRQVLNVLQQHPNLRLSTQMHKVLNVE